VRVEKQALPLKGWEAGKHPNLTDVSLRHVGCSGTCPLPAIPECFPLQGSDKAIKVYRCAHEGCQRLCLGVLCSLHRQQKQTQPVPSGPAAEPDHGAGGSSIPADHAADQSTSVLFAPSNQKFQISDVAMGGVPSSLFAMASPDRTHRSSTPVFPKTPENQTTTVSCARPRETLTTTERDA